MESIFVQSNVFGLGKIFFKNLKLSKLFYLIQNFSMRALNTPAENLSIALYVKNKYLGRASEEPHMEAKT